MRPKHLERHDKGGTDTPIRQLDFLASLHTAYSVSVAITRDGYCMIFANQATETTFTGWTQAAFSTRKDLFRWLRMRRDALKGIPVETTMKLPCKRLISHRITL